MNSSLPHGHCYCPVVDTAPAQQNTKHWRSVVAVVVTTIAIPIIPFVIVGELPGQQWLQASGTSAFGFGFTGAVLLTLDVVLPIPSSIVGTLLGARLGIFVGFLWTFFGLFVGHLIGFSLGRLWPARFAPTLAHTPTGIAVFLSRPVPVFAEAVAIAAGASRLPWRTYLPWCLAGDAIYAAGLATNGAHFLPEKLFLPALLLPMGLPVLSWGAWKLWQRAKRAK
jgi:uncharacterized membrane protein YdjX (TVP38/TMEM64 family)